MATKKTIIGCNKFNDKSAISNSNFTTNLKQSLTLNEGDTISVKTSFIDTRNKIPGYYTVDKDIEIEMEYYFYYINRGGNNVKSMQLGKRNLEPKGASSINTKKQCIACDSNDWAYDADNLAAQNFAYPTVYPPYYLYDDPDALNPINGNTDPNGFRVKLFQQHIPDNSRIDVYPTLQHASYKNLTQFPITNDSTATGKVQANLNPLLESVYHCYSQVNLDNTKSKYTKNGVFDQSAFGNNPSGFNNVLDVNSADGLPYLLHYYIPENLEKNYVVTPVNFTDMVIGQTYSIIDTGLPWLNRFNTSWTYISSTLTSPVNGINFVCEETTNNEFSNFTDINSFDTINQFIINNSFGIDFGLYGGQSLPENTNPIVNMYNNVVVDKWYKFIGDITPKFLDGSVLSFYKDICGFPENEQPNIGDMFISIANSPPGTSVSVNGNINNVAPGMTLQVVSAGLIDWELLGYVNPSIETPFTFTVSKNPANFTDETYNANLLVNDTIQEIVNYTFPLPAFKPTSQIQGVNNYSFNADVVATGKVGTENIKDTNYDNKAMNTGKMVPFTKTFKFILKKGSYSPDYLAEILSRAMSKQKAKKNVINGKIQLSTPTKLMTEQLIDYKTLQTGANAGNPAQFYGNMNYNQTSILQSQADLVNSVGTVHHYYNSKLIHPFLHQGAFPYNVPNQYDSEGDMVDLWNKYIPNNNFAPKNKNILPTGQNLDNTSLPINPKYTSNDFNYNMSLNGDDTPFLYRPAAYGTRSDYDSGQMSIKLAYNDSNYEYLNSTLPEFGKNPDGSVRVIEMSYKPLCHDVSSPYFENIMATTSELNDITDFKITTDYSIRPVISTAFSTIGTRIDAETYPVTNASTGQVEEYSQNFNYSFKTATGTRNITSPLVGSTQMSIVYNQENNGIFAFPYLHTAIYAKADPTTSSTQESIGIYSNTSYIPTKDASGNITNVATPSVIQCESQSGIIFKSLKARYVDGSGESTFWTDLGFDVDAICLNKENDDNLQITYDDFISKTSRGFCGTSNIYDNVSKNDGSEVSPISFFDSRQIMGFPLKPNTTINVSTYYLAATTNYVLFNEPIYFAVDTTEAVNAVNTFTNLNDTGHVLLSVEGYNGALINSQTKMNIKSIISSYYSSANFITNPNSEDIVYEHVGEPLDINNLKIVLIDPFTGNEVENIGPNSSIYFSVNQQLQFQNTNQKKN